MLLRQYTHRQTHTHTHTDMVQTQLEECSVGVNVQRKQIRPALGKSLHRLGVNNCIQAALMVEYA